MSRSVTLLTRACYVSVKAGTVPVCPWIDIYGLCRACVGRSSGTDPSCLMYIYWQCLEGVYVRPTCTVMPCSQTCECGCGSVWSVEVMHFRNSY